MCEGGWMDGCKICYKDSLKQSIKKYLIFLSSGGGLNVLYLVILAEQGEHGPG
jgi:hypothetical protein